MTKTRRVRGRMVALAGVAMVGAMLAGCGSGKSARVADAGRGGAGGGTPGSGGLGAGGQGTGGALGGTDGGTAAGGVGGRATGGVGAGGAGGLGAGGTGVGGTGAGGTGAGGTGVGGTGAGGTGDGGTGMADAPTCVGTACPGSDASANDVPMSSDSGSGGLGSGGRSTTTGGAGGGAGAGGTFTGGVTSAGGSRTGGVTSAGGSGGGSGGTSGAACTRAPDKDYYCPIPSYPPRAYLCAVSAPPPSAACVYITRSGSVDIHCCPDGFVACPDSLPADATACPGAVRCSYGSHPDMSCRTRADCSNGTWQVTAPPARCSDPLPAAGCPATPVGGADCSPDGLECYYATGDYCICAQCTRETPSCILDAPIIWHCLAPPSPACPALHPNVGAACDLSANSHCRYRCDVVSTCSAEGVWVDGGDNCPICNAPDTPIATPDGNRPIASLVRGDLVYSIHRGELVIVPIAETGRRAAQPDHRVVRLLLATGMVLEISPRHPTADGRTMGDLAANDQLDGVRIISATLVPFRHSHTYDILPASDTGTYYAGGMLIGSTMAPSHRLASVPVPACTIR